jgi:hypothetical protein
MNTHPSILTKFWLSQAGHKASSATLRIRARLRLDGHRLLGTDKWPGRLWRAVAWVLPWKLAYWAAVRIMAHATTGDYGCQDVTTLTCLQALKRWHDDQETNNV